MKTDHLNTTGAVLSRRMRVLALMAFALLLCGTVGVRAQQITGRILGTVVDTSGAAVPNANITVTNQGTGVVLTTVSGNDGLYNLPQVAAGNYTVEAAAPGFSPAQVKDVLVTVGSDSRVDLKVAVGSVNQAVTVTEAVPLVNTTSSDVGGTVGEQTVADLPLNGRNWTDLTILEAGITQLRNNLVTAGIAGTVYSSNGADIRSNNYLLDGAIMQNIFAVNNASVLGTSLGVDGIKEYKVVTNMFGAEYGLMMGSQTTIVSKSGANAWHGDAFDYLRNDALDAAQFFDNRDTTNLLGFGTDKSFVYPDKRIPPFHRNNFGGSFGGPIKKDKTFFYGVYEGLRQTWGQTITTKTLPAACFTAGSTPTSYTHLTGAIPAACTGGSAVPVESAASVILASNFPYPNIVGQPAFNYSFPFIQPSSENYGQMRVDQTFSANDSGFIRYTHDDADQTSPASYLNIETLLHSASQFLTVGETHVLTPTLLNTIRGSGSRTQLVDNFVAAPGQTVTRTDNYFPIPVTISPGSGVTAFASNNAVGPPPGSLQNIITGTDDLYWTKGKHAFKFGFMYNHFQDNLNYYLFAGGSLSFPNLTGFYSGSYSNVQWITQNSSQSRQYIYQTFGFYGEDDYRILPRLTLNLGLRYEFSTVPRGGSGQQIYEIPNPAAAVAGTATPEPGIYTNPTLHNFGPRVGLAWDVRGNGKTAVRMGGGIYYDVGLLGGLLTNNSCCTPPTSDQVIVVNQLATPVVPLTIPVDNMVPAVPNNQYAPRTIQYQGEQPSLGQWNLSVDQQLPAGMGLTVSYVGARGWHLWKIDELNPVLPQGSVNGLPYFCKTPDGGPPTSSDPCNVFPTIRVNPNLSQIYGEVPESEDWYDALEVVLTKRLTHGLQFQSAFTYERQIDTQQNQSGADSTERYQAPGNPDNIDKGVSTYNIPLNEKFNITYHVPNYKPDSGWTAPFHGWWIASIVSLQSGVQFNVTDGVNRSLVGGANQADRPSLDPSFNYKTLVTGNINGWFVPTMFDLQPAGTYGNAPVNVIPGPSFKNWDFSANKDTKLRWLGEAGVVQFRAEFFNILNHPSFGPPNTTLLSLSSATTAPAGGQAGSTGIALNPNVGKITATASNSREIQFSLKVIF